MKKVTILLMFIIVAGLFVFAKNLNDKPIVVVKKKIKKKILISKKAKLNKTPSDSKQVKEIVDDNHKEKISLKASNLDATKIQLFNKNINYLEQPSLNDLVVIYRELEQPKLKEFISKIEQFMSQKNYIKRHNAKELSEQESLFFASLTHRLSAARLVKLQKRIADMGDVDDEGS